jgi:hypothetical protein
MEGWLKQQCNFVTYAFLFFWQGDPGEGRFDSAINARVVRFVEVEGMRDTMISLLKLWRQERYGALFAKQHPSLAPHVTDA